MGWRAGVGAQVPTGFEFQVNTYTTNSQLYASVATGPDGGFVVGWQSVTQDDGVFRGVFARRHSSDGAPLAGEFQVNSHTPGNQVLPSVAIAAGGSFMVAWHGTDGSAAGVFARLFSSAGVPLDHDFQVNTYTYNWQSEAAVAALVDDGYVVVWRSGSLVGAMQDGSDSGVFARLFSRTGLPRAPEFQVNSRTVRDQGHPSVAADSAGNFVIVWESSGQDGSRSSVFAKRFSSAGTAIADEFQVNAHTRGYQRLPALGGVRSVAVDEDGDFVVAWESIKEYSIRFRDVCARRFSSAGIALANEFQVHAYTVDEQTKPAVATDAAGNFVATWASLSPSALGVFGRFFSSLGDPQAGEFRVNNSTWADQPSVAVDADGDFVVVWLGLHDGAGSGVFAQRFLAGVVAPTTTATITPTPTSTATATRTASATLTPTNTITATPRPEEPQKIPMLSGRFLTILALVLVIVSVGYLSRRRA